VQVEILTHSLIDALQKQKKILTPMPRLTLPITLPSST